MYKLYYKYHSIEFVNINDSFQIKNNEHSLINPTNLQIKTAIYHCFIESTKIQSLFLFCDNPKETFNSFVDSLIFIEAAGGIVMNDMNEWLFIKRAGVWDLPKGKIDEGETIPAAAIREVKEETNIKSISIVKELSPSFHIYFENGNWYFKKNHWFLMLSAKEKLTPQVEEKITEARWMNKNGIKKIYYKLFPSIRKVVEEACNFNYSS